MFWHLHKFANIRRHQVYICRLAFLVYLFQTFSRFSVCQTAFKELHKTRVRILNDNEFLTIKSIDNMWQHNQSWSNQQIRRFPVHWRKLGDLNTEGQTHGKFINSGPESLLSIRPIYQSYHYKNMLFVFSHLQSIINNWVHEFTYIEISSARIRKKTSYLNLSKIEEEWYGLGAR